MLRTALSEILDTWYLHNYKAFFVGVVILLICIGSYLIYRLFAWLFHRKIKHVSPFILGWRALLLSLFGVYGYFLIAITILSREPGEVGTGLNLELFSSLTGSNFMRMQAFENVMLFIPFGVFIALTFWTLWGRCGKFWFSLLWGFSSSLLIELTQLIFHCGVFEADDILMNTLGSLLGYLAIFTIWCIWTFYRKFCKKLRPVVQVLMIVLILSVIFDFSADNGEESEDLSKRVTQQIVMVLDVFIPGEWSEYEQAQAVEALNPVVRKMAHMAEYALLAGATFYFLYERRLRGKKLYLPTWLFCLVISIADEIHQLSVAGREGAVRDVGFDMLGVTLLLMLIGGYDKFRRRHWVT